jgi:hypothetical protein
LVSTGIFGTATYVVRPPLFQHMYVPMLERFIPDRFEPLKLANICIMTRLSGDPIGPHRKWQA